MQRARCLQVYNKSALLNVITHNLLCVLLTIIECAGPMILRRQINYFEMTLLILANNWLEILLFSLVF